VYLAPIGNDDAVRVVTDELYNVLTDAGIGVLYDDRDERPGTKFADADLLGIPLRVVVSSKTVGDAKYEVKSRTATEPEFLDKAALLKRLGL
jgi:prolyl-tRNA synthetase